MWRTKPARHHLAPTPRKQTPPHSPFEEAAGGDEAGAGAGVAGQLLGLPPERVRLVHDLQDVASFEADAGVGAGDGGVLLGAVVGHGSHVHLKTPEVSSRRCFCASKRTGGGFTMVWLWTGRSVIGTTLNMMVP